MNEDEKKHFEELIFKAVQSGKKETSDLVDMIMHKLENGIEESINRNVNGKIKVLTQRFDDYVVSDNEWKDGVTPSIDIMKKVKASSSVIRWVVQTVILLGILIGTITGLIKLFK